MGKEKEIEEMANICLSNTNNWSTHSQGFCYAQAEALSNAGYGNVKQAVKEFAEKLKEKIFRYEEVDGEDICDDVDNLFKELYGEDL